MVFQIPGLTTLAQGQNQTSNSASSSTAVPAEVAPVPASAEQTNNTGEPMSAQIVSGPASNEHVTTIVKPLSAEGALVTASEKQSSTFPATAQDAEKDVSSAGHDTAMQVDHLDADTVAQSAQTGDSAPSPPSLTQGLEALLAGLDAQPDEVNSATSQVVVAGEQNTEMADVVAEQDENDQEHPEWEVDSSPYESSSDSSSSDDSDDDDDSADGNALLNPEEMARILMEAASDDEGEGKAKGSGGPLRTKNEIPEEIVPRPDVTITADMQLHKLGEIEHVVDNSIVVKAYTSGEYQVLDPGSILCKEDRTVIAVLADLIGSVREPRYTARFTNDDEIKALELEVGTQIYYVSEFATFVFTKPLQAQKGTDASNLNDEEVEADEMEFSDDEKEAAYKKSLKDKKRARQAARGGSQMARGGGRAGPELPQTPTSLNYDDDDEDGPYRPLARPANFGQSSSAAAGNDGGSYRGGRGGRGGRGDFRGGRDDFRGRGRGNRNASRGGPGYPQAPMASGYGQEPQMPQQPNFSFQAPVLPQYGANQGYPLPPPFFGANNGQPAMQNFPPAWPQPPQNLPANFVPPPPPGFQQPGQAGQTGNQFNPAFFAGLQNHLANQYQGPTNQVNNQQPPQWPPQGSSG